ncbi:MAG: neuromedin U [Bacteroidota bacterium]
MKNCHSRLQIVRCCPRFWAQYLLILAYWGLVAVDAWAQDSQESLSQEVANPVADLISIPLQNNLNGNQGAFDRNTNILHIQPVVPLLGGQLITRTIFPIVSIPDFASESGIASSGLADIVFTGFYVPKDQPFIWGAGPVIEIPAGGSERGTEKWSLGPSVVGLVQSEDWTLGILVNNVWSIAGDSERADVNRMFINLFITRQLGNGWYVNTAPIITSDWKARGDDRWIVPLGAGGGKVLFVGKLPLNVQTQMYYNVVRPDFGPEWQWRLQLALLLPTSMFK